MKPRLCLTIGVTGHREHKLDGTAIAQLTASIDTTLALLQHALQAVGKQHHKAVSAEQVQLRLVTA